MTTIWEFFGHLASDRSIAAQQAAQQRQCPFVGGLCEKTLSDGELSGVCSIKPAKSDAVICCPHRLYADDYRILQDVARMAFGQDYELVDGPHAATRVRDTMLKTVAVFGKKRGRELRLPQRDGRGGYFVDWVLALLNEQGDLLEFVAVEVQTIDTTGNYRNGRAALFSEARVVEKTTAGLNWENVSKRILPQLVYKGQVLQREALCRKGLFFVCPVQVFDKIKARLGGAQGLVRHPLQPASITFLPYRLDLNSMIEKDGYQVPLMACEPHSTTVYRVQEAFNNVTLPDENVYRDAILAALCAAEK